SPQRFTDGGNSITRYAHRHTFTLVNPGTITIDLASAPANRPPLDTYLILLKGHSGDGTGTVAGRDDDSGTGTNSRLSSIKLAPGDYSVEATTDKYRRTGDYDLTIDAAPGAGAACTGDLGILAAGRYTRTGTVAAVEGCASAQRGTPTSRPWARWHTFTLAEPAWVDIDLAAATASSLDPYLLLLSGDDNTGTILAQDDSSGTGTAAQIRGRHLQAGTYIIEATAAASTGTTSTGAYTLTVTVPIHGLPQTIHATVDQQTTTNFTYWPADARTRIARDSVSARESLRMLYSSAAGTGTLSLEVPIVDTHQLGLNYSSEVGMSSGQTRSAIRSGQSDTTDRQFGVEVRGGCDPGEIVSPYNGLRCVPFEGAADDVVLPSTRGSKFQVTRGTLIGVDQAAREALAAYNVSSQGPCQAAAVTDTYLAAVLLSIPFKEVRTGYRTSPARSPMSLPRTDYAKNAKSPLVKLYSFDDFTKDPKRAFWHPSAGLWKIDDTYGYKGTFELNHADRAHVITAAKHATKHILPALCSDSVVSDSDKDKAFSKWLGCHFPSLGVNHECRLEVLPKLYVEATSSRPEGLWVTTEHNKNDYSLTGGVSSHRCRWGVSGASFSCWFYDAAKRQGYVDIFDPEADDPVNFDGTVYKPVRSPLAAPFLSFNHGERLGEQRFVVFPHSLLSGDDPVVSDTLIKAVPTDDETGSARAWYPVSDDPLVDADDPDGDEDDDHSWEVNTYGQQVLWVQVCPPGIWELGGNLCQWVSTNAGDSDPLGSFATRIRALGY
ncbi:MAG: hypothetical protein OXN87_03455, partial [Chloroflexota bacterium]|nr:hypothetical protein [Chloroflexota bacterium]